MKCMYTSMELEAADLGSMRRFLWGAGPDTELVLHNEGCGAYSITEFPTWRNRKYSNIMGLMNTKDVLYNHFFNPDI